MVRHSIAEIEPAELAAGEIEVDLLAQPPFRADAEQPTSSILSISFGSIDGCPVTL